MHDVRVVRLPRHAASCPVGIGVSCSADRNIKAKITADGIFLEQLEKNPARFLPKEAPNMQPAVELDLDEGMDKVRETLSKYPVFQETSYLLRRSREDSAGHGFGQFRPDDRRPYGPLRGPFPEPRRFVGDGGQG